MLSSDMDEDQSAIPESSPPRKLSRLRKARAANVADDVPAVGKQDSPPCIEHAEEVDEQNSSLAPQAVLASNPCTEAVNTDVNAAAEGVVACVDGEARESSPGEDLETNDNEEYWDEEDELQKQLEDSQQGEEEPGEYSATAVQMPSSFGRSYQARDSGRNMSAGTSNVSAKSVDGDEADGESEGEDFGSDMLLAETQRILRGEHYIECLSVLPQSLRSHIAV